MTDNDGLGREIAELEAAAQTRLQGNEGRARVQARRAAGWAVGRFYARRFGDAAQRSAYTMLRWLNEQPDIDPALRAAAGRLITRVNHDHRMPFVEDPLDDARRIVETLNQYN